MNGGGGGVLFVGGTPDTEAMELAYVANYVRPAGAKLVVLLWLISVCRASYRAINRINWMDVYVDALKMTEGIASGVCD